MSRSLPAAFLRRASLCMATGFLVLSVAPALALADDSTVVVESPNQVVRGWDGTGQVIAVVDTGIDETHPFYAGRLIDEACFANTATGCPNGASSQTGAGAAAAQYANENHATAVAGLAAGKRFGSGTIDGVAPGAKIMPINIYPEGGGANPLTQKQALDYVLGRVNAGVPVASVVLSAWDSGNYSTDCDSVPLKASIDALKAKGVATIIASGNDGYTTGVSGPACISSAVTVGATTLSDVVASYSNSSPQVELLAPGSCVTLAIKGGGFSNCPIAGTSWSAPQVAGAWASYLQRYPGTSVDSVLAAMQRGGKPVTDSRNGVTVPRLNVANAMSGWGFVVDNSPTTVGTHIPAATLQGNSAGSSAVNSVVRDAVGTYRVLFPRLGDGARGNAQVHAYNSSTNRCKVTTLGTGSMATTTEIGVACTDAAGASADTSFVAQFQVAENLRALNAGYVTDLVPGASSTPASDLQATSNNQTATITRTATGKYQVNFAGWTGSSGVPQVSTILGGANACQLTGWTGSTASVACFTAAGVAADNRFALAFNDSHVVTGRRGAYIYANNATATTAYSPTSSLNWNSQGSTNTSQKTATGTYAVVLGQQAAVNAFPIVSAVDSAAGTSCTPMSFAASGSNTLVVVRCTNLAGAATDAKFVLTYASAV